MFSVSTEPPILMFSVSDKSSSTPTIRTAETVVVHLFGSDQLNIAQLCATSGIDRFADASLWDRLETGEPYFPSADAWIRGRVINRMSAGRSRVVAVHALECRITEDDEASAPLVYRNRTWHRLGEHSTIET